MAADGGIYEAHMTYGNCLSNGEGVPRNLSEAARYYKMAADHGNVLAQIVLQELVQRGL